MNAKMQGFVDWLDDRIDKARHQANKFSDKMDEESSEKELRDFFQAWAEWQEHFVVLNEVKEELEKRRLL